MILFIQKYTKMIFSAKFRIWLPKGRESGRKDNQQKRETGKLSGLMEMFYHLFGRELPGST